MSRELDNRVEKAVDLAQEAFWAVIAEQFPEVITGDLDPYSSTLFELECEKIVKEWYQNNNIRMKLPEDVWEDSSVLSDSFMEELKLILNEFESQEWHSTGMNFTNGGYVKAEYDGHDDEIIDIMLEWGTNDMGDGISTQRSERYKIYKYDVMDSTLTVKEKVSRIFD